jgi:hypothetical protein
MVLPQSIRGAKDLNQTLKLGVINCVLPKAGFLATEIAFNKAQLGWETTPKPHSFGCTGFMMLLKGH